MAADVDKLVEYIWCEEGGASYTNYDKPTKYGVTLDTLKEYKHNQSLNATAVQNLTAQEAKDILVNMFWYKYHGDKIEDEWIAYYLVDWAYNGYGASYIKECANGGSGNLESLSTIAAINSTAKSISPQTLFKNLAQARLNRYRTLKGWSRNAGGWTRRALYDMVYGAFVKRGCSVSTAGLAPSEYTGGLWGSTVSTGITLTGTQLTSIGSLDASMAVDSSDFTAPPRIYQEFSPTIEVDELSIRLQQADGTFINKSLNDGFATTSNNTTQFPIINGGTGNESYQKYVHLSTTPPTNVQLALNAIINRIYVPINQAWKAKYGSTVKINCSYRTEAENKKAGGSSTSQHLRGEALDLDVGNASENKLLFQLVKDSKLPYDQLILETASGGKAWVHVSYTTTKNKGQSFTYYNNKRVTEITTTTFNPMA